MAVVVQEGVFIYLVGQKRPFYYVGEQVRGGILVKALHPILIKGITLTFTCRAFADLQVERGYHSKYRHDSGVRHGENLLVNESWFVVGNGRDDLLLPAGETSYTFHSKLPDGPAFPCSYFWAGGRIMSDEVRAGVMYSIRADVLVASSTGSSQLNSWSQMMPIYVVHPVDLNVPELSYLGNPVEATSSQSFRTLSPCCFCCVSPKVTITLRLRKTGYCSGETVPFDLEVSERGLEYIKELNVEIDVALGLYGKLARGKCKSNIDRKTLIAEGVEPQGTEGKFTGELNLPENLYPSNLGVKGGGVISLLYYFKVVGDGPWCAGDSVELTVPLCIGTTPLRSPDYVGNRRSK